MADNNTEYDSFFQRDDHTDDNATAMTPLTATTTAAKATPQDNHQDSARDATAKLDAVNVMAPDFGGGREESNSNNNFSNIATVGGTAASEGDGGYANVCEDALPPPLPEDDCDVMEINSASVKKKIEAAGSLKDDGVDANIPASENTFGPEDVHTGENRNANNGSGALKSDFFDSKMDQNNHATQISSENTESNNNSNNNDGQNKPEVELIPSNSDSEDIVVIDKPKEWVEKPQSAATTTAAPLPFSASAISAPTAGSLASFYARNQQMPQWMSGITNANNAVNSYYSQYAQALNVAAQLQYQQNPQISAAAVAGFFNPYGMNFGGGFNNYTPNPLSYGTPTYIELPSYHTPTWLSIIPEKFFEDLEHRNRIQQENSHRYKKITLSLINVWEFTIDIDGGYNQSIASGLRSKIKKIAREHVGQGGRKGALFERGSTMPDDPVLKSATSGNGDEAGKWRIPLGAYQALLTYLTSDPMNIVDGIPAEQLKAATLGRERMDRKDVPSVKALIRKGVFPGVAAALAPYQRVGVDFILEKDGRCLLADEMGLGKTVQAIASMSAFFKDWPLLVLCPSTARYHWQNELNHWLGNKLTDEERRNLGKIDVMDPLEKDHSTVISSGKGLIFPKRGKTKVVICSFGLIVSLVDSNRITPGMFNAVIVDESHALKSKSTKRTKAVLPLLHAAERCLLLSGTPALARPSELWPQISVLGGRRKDGTVNDSSGIFEDEEEFMSKYVLKGDRGDEIGTKSRLAELHTLLTSTIMIRRMKADILKNLPSKVREKAYIKVEDDKARHEFKYYMQLLRQGKGVLGKLARQNKEQSASSASSTDAAHPSFLDEDYDTKKSKEVLHHLYHITGRSKIKKVTKMLKSWLADYSKGKLCIFAHHLDVLDAIALGAGLSNHRGSLKRFIRIDGSTTPKLRQEQIEQFQSDPLVRIAMLGITAAGVAVTLTASSTVWFAELFWTPAIMIQAEDRCHRIGQQARVRCLYFIAKGTLDEVLWKLIEKKFRDLGEFVEGKENMDIALERTLEDDEEDEILKVEAEDAASRKRKSQDELTDYVDTDDIDLNTEIDELVHEEEEMLKIGKEDDEIDSEEADKESSSNEKIVSSSKESAPAEEKDDAVIDLMDGEDEEETKAKQLTIGETRQLYKESGVRAKVKIEPNTLFKKLRIYRLKYPGPTYGLIMVSCNGRVVVKSFHSKRANRNWSKPEVGHIIIAVNNFVLPREAPFTKVLQLMKHFMTARPPVTLTFAEDEEFTSLFREDILPTLPSNQKNKDAASSAPSSSTGETSSAVAAPSYDQTSPTQQIAAQQLSQGTGVIELLDDD
mmetsp:Transcript_4105/g.9367  ORF Transcript_4105/g.9367 Transcript_4105/m.9367 type:complete len:1323 (-) Transcript_4105:34-4002(-)